MFRCSRCACIIFRSRISAALSLRASHTRLPCSVPAIVTLSPRFPLIPLSASDSSLYLYIPLIARLPHHVPPAYRDMLYGCLCSHTQVPVLLFPAISNTYYCMDQEKLSQLFLLYGFSCFPSSARSWIYPASLPDSDSLYPDRYFYDRFRKYSSQSVCNPKLPF